MLARLLNWLGGYASDAANWIADTVAVPSWVTDLLVTAKATIAQFAGLRHWVPLDLLAIVGIGLAVLWATGMVVKVVRIILSFMTLGGGSAA